MNNQEQTNENDVPCNPECEFEEDEHILCYYDALIQSIREGIEDPDLMTDEDIEAAFSYNRKKRKTWSGKKSKIMYRAARWWRTRKDRER